MNQLDALKQLTTVVADSGDIESIRQFEPGRHHQPFADPESRRAAAVQGADRRSAGLRTSSGRQQGNPADQRQR